MKSLYLILAFLLFISCGNGSKKETSAVNSDVTIPKQTDPLAKIASLYKVTVTPVPEGNEGANPGSYTVKVDNLNLETKTPYSPAFIASKSAMIIYKSFTDQDKKNYSSITINVNSNFKTEALIFKLTDLQKIDPYLKIAQSAVKKYIDGDYEEFYELTDHAYLTREAHNDLINNHRKPYPEVFETIEKINDDGFEFRREEGLNVISVYFTTKSADGTALEWDIIFLDNDENMKIVGFHIIP
jgi:predicted transcriptional regulator